MARPRNPSPSMSPHDFYTASYREMIKLRKEAILHNAWTAAGRFQAMAMEAYANIPRVEETAGAFDELDDHELMETLLGMMEILPQEIAQQMFLSLAERLGYPLGPRLVGGE